MVRSLVIFMAICSTGASFDASAVTQWYLLKRYIYAMPAASCMFGASTLALFANLFKEARRR